MKKLTSLRAFGLNEEAAIRYYITMLMADHGLLTASNMISGTGFTIQGGDSTGRCDTLSGSAKSAGTIEDV